MLLQYKREHPSKLIAMQVGDFFEFAGWDAVMAIQTNKLLGMGLRAPLLLACTPVYLTALQIRLGTIKPSNALSSLSLSCSCSTSSIVTGI